MSQLLYLLASLAGVAAMIGLCAALFGRSTVAIEPERAIERLAFDVPGFRAGSIAVAADKRSALIEDARDGALYLVAARGDGLVTRRLSESYVKAASRDGAALSLRFADITFPRTALAFADETSARDWEARMARL